jgi:hypothetical protein
MKYFLFIVILSLTSCLPEKLNDSNKEAIEELRNIENIKMFSMNMLSGETDSIMKSFLRINYNEGTYTNSQNGSITIDTISKKIIKSIFYDLKETLLNNTPEDESDYSLHKKMMNGQHVSLSTFIHTENDEKIRIFYIQKDIPFKLYNYYNSLLKMKFDK